MKCAGGEHDRCISENLDDIIGSLYESPPYKPYKTCVRSKVVAITRLKTVVTRSVTPNCNCIRPRINYMLAKGKYRTKRCGPYVWRSYCLLSVAKLKYLRCTQWPSLAGPLSTTAVALDCVRRTSRMQASDLLTQHIARSEVNKSFRAPRARFRHTSSSGPRTNPVHTEINDRQLITRSYG